MKIKFLNGEYAGEIREFDEPEISIGREDGNSIQLLTGGVSRYHAQIIKKEDGSYFISDLNSTNGVKIDGVPIANDRVLCPGDEITIGEQKLLIAELSGVPKIFFKTFSDNSETLMDTRIDEPQPAAQLNTGSKNASAPTENKAKNDTQLSADKLLAELKSVSGNLFNSGADRKNGSSTATQSDKADPGKAKPRSKMLFNVVFYAALVICVASVAKFLMDGSKKTSTANAAVQEIHNENTVVYFERIDYSTDKKSAFRVELKIENGKLFCLLDDIAGQRHFTREIELSGNYDNELEILIQKLKKSGILTLKQKNISITNPDTDQLHLVFIDGKDYCNYKCSSNETGAEFDKCYEAVRDFLNGFGLVTIAQSREEVEDEAKQHLRNAIEHMENYAGDYSLLRSSAREFEAAISCYEQFTPAPPELKKARLGFDKVNALRKQKLQEFNADFARCRNRKDYPGMAAACQNIMKIAGEKSKVYRQAANVLLNVKRQMDSRKR